MSDLEYAAAINGAGFLVRDDRTILRMYGKDPLRILQGIVTNDVAGAPEDGATYATLLSAKGRMQADMRILRQGSDFILDVPRAALPSLLDLFRRTVPPLFARFEDRSATHAVIGVYGARAAHILTAVYDVDVTAVHAERFMVMRFDDASDADGHIVIATALVAGSLHGFDILAPLSSVASLCERLAASGAVPITRATFDTVRIEGGMPMWDAELDETTIPLEANLLERAISTSKGCYTGQEVIIRILHRGHVNRHLRGILLGSAIAPLRGSELVRPADGKVVGHITSAAYSPAMKQTIAMGYVRREVDVQSVLKTTEGADATVVALPFTRG